MLSQLLLIQLSNMLAHQEKFKCFGHRIPHYFWFMLSGAICDIAQALIDYFIYKLYVFDEYGRATVCWTLSYSISIFIRHYSHRIIVFGDYEGSYCNSLTRTYLTYSSSIVLSMICNHLLVRFGHLTHRDAWIVTMIWTGVYNYFLLKANWGAKAKDSEVKDKPVVLITSV